MTNKKPASTLESASKQAFLFLVALASILLLSTNLPFDTLIVPSQFFLIHNILEGGGILIAAMIFIIAWAPLEEQRTIRYVILTSAFLGLCAMEMAHLLSFDGTFASSLENAKAISFKLALVAQTFLAIGLLSFAYCPVRNMGSKLANLSLCLFEIVSAGIIAYIFRTTDSSSHILNSVNGPSIAANIFEACIGGLYLIAGLALFQRSKKTRNFPSLAIGTAAVILAMSTFLFNKYFHINDLNSLLGYLFKLSAYILFFRALVYSNIEQPYVHIQSLKQRFESTLDALPDLVFETSLEGRIYEYHSDPAKNSLIANPKAFIGHNLNEFLPSNATRACMTALKESSEKGKSYGQQYSLMQLDGEHHYEISASALIDTNEETRFLMIVRDISIRYSLSQRLEALLSLSEKSEGLEEQDIAAIGLTTLENLTKSKVSFLHFLSPDESQIEAFAWGDATDPNYFKTEKELLDPVESIGIWTDCVRTREAVIINEYSEETATSALENSHSELKRFLSVPIFEGGRIRMIIGVGNADHKYSDSAIHTVELFGSELYQIIQRRRSQSEAEKNRLLLTTALENLPVGVAITKSDENIHFEYFNKQFAALYDVPPELVTSFDSFWDVAVEDENLRSRMKKKMREDYASGDFSRMRWERIPIKRKGKAQKYLTVQTVPVTNTTLSVTLVEDVTETMRKEEEIRIAAAAFSSQEGILITDSTLHILRVNKAFERSSGYSAVELIGKTPAFLHSGYHDSKFYEQMWKNINESGVWRGEVWNKSKDGNLAPYSLTISAVKNALGMVTHFVADYIDLSAIKNAQETISRLSYFDTLTGLPNREHIKSMLSDQKLKTHSSAGYVSALMIDIDNFKTINETLGHECGDLLLLQIAQRLQTLLRSGDQVARYGGDEFVILLADLGEDTEQASLKTQLLAQSVIYGLEDTYVVDGHDYFSTASIGATLFSASEPNAQEVFKQLDIALSSAKSDGENQIRFFDPAWQESVSNRARVLDELRTAIKEQQLELFYQPQLNGHGQIIGCEGLIRWNHPTRGLLPPSEFLPIAQENNLMIKIGDEVLRMGLKQLHQWQEQSAFSHIKLSLNITADQFYETRFEKALLALLNEFEITQGSLMLEFTESMILGNVDEAREKIIRLNEADIEFAIDDFGTGYSSLSYLSTLPMDQLKIDQSFVRNIGVIETDTQIVKAIINMARILELGVIAEGVETQAQLDYLKTQNCELFQGYLFSKPVPIAQFNKLVLNCVANIT